ncbi:hypothetical protein ABB27_14555 [Stenotrophomonas terrae]|uniref:Uncharacterized protein n=1 Tax=Stenotrophomonas terrae TaxID=405446 RepID=A0A0R0C7Z8_9GAMM|nr:hypothetical protein ABB27_14555 [Stenotrophomonas terrae]
MFIVAAMGMLASIHGGMLGRQRAQQRADRPPVSEIISEDEMRRLVLEAFDEYGPDKQAITTYVIEKCLRRHDGEVSL